MKLFIFALLGLVGCGGAQYQTLQLVNHTDRAIPEIYFYPMGSTDHGKPVTSLPANGKTEVKVRGGRVEMYAVSAKIQIDEYTRDVPSATQDLELDRPLQIHFYDATAKPSGLEGHDVIGVAFSRTKTNAPPPESLH